MKLPKPHYAGGIPSAQLTAANYDYWVEYARTTGFMGHGYWCNEPEMDYCVRVCKEAGAKLVVHWSPWHMLYFKPDLTTGRSWSNLENPPAPTLADLNSAVESNRYKVRLYEWRTWLTSANKRNAARVTIAAVCLDCERFDATKADDTESDRICAAQDGITILTEAAFPLARVIWYARALWPDGTMMPWWTGAERTTAITPQIYSVPRLFSLPGEMGRLIAVNRTEKDNRGAELIPYIALGAGYTYPDGKATWHDNLEYDTALSERMGAVVWDKPINAVVLYPVPFTENQRKHFAAYCQGMTA